MKNFFIVIEIKENNKYYSYMIKANSSDNLYLKLNNINNIISATICNTQKEAKHRVAHYNAIYKVHGTNLY